MKRLLILLLTLCSSILICQTSSIYVSDAGNFNNPPWQILRFDENGQNPSVFINNNLNWPQDILFLNDSIVLISNLGSNKISMHNANSGAYLSDFATGISGPTRIKIGPDNLLYALQWSGNGKVKRYDLNGNFQGDFTSVGVPQSIGLDWDSKGNLYVSSYSGDLVRKFDQTGADLGLFIASNLAGPTNIWFDSNGDLLVSDYDGTAVKRFDSTGVYLGNFIQGLNKSEGVAFMPNGDILIGNGSTHSVKQFSNTGNYIRDIITNGSGNLINPNAIVVKTSLTVGFEENLKNSTPVRPTIGRSFIIDEPVFQGSESISIFNAKGQLIERLEMPSWDATSAEEGIYFMVFTLRDHGAKVQRILVD